MTEKWLAKLGLTKASRRPDRVMMPERGKSVLLHASYCPEDGMIRLADPCLIGRLSDGGQGAVTFLSRWDRQNELLNMLRVLTLSEEVAHFVQHAQGQLPPELGVEEQPIVAVNGETPIVDQELLWGEEQRDLWRFCQLEVFQIMGYGGHPPAGLIVLREPWSVNPAKMANRTYIDYVTDNRANERWPFEQQALDIAKAVTFSWLHQHLLIDEEPRIY